MTQAHDFLLNQLNNAWETNKTVLVNVIQGRAEILNLFMPMTIIKTGNNDIAK